MYIEELDQEVELNKEDPQDIFNDDTSETDTVELESETNTHEVQTPRRAYRVWMPQRRIYLLINRTEHTPTP